MMSLRSPWLLLTCSSALGALLFFATACLPLSPRVDDEDDEAALLFSPASVAFISATGFSFPSCEGKTLAPSVYVLTSEMALLTEDPRCLAPPLGVAVVDMVMDAVVVLMLRYVDGNGRRDACS